MRNHDGLHTQLGEVHDLDRFDGVLVQDRRRAADRTEVKTAVLLAGVGHLLRNRQDEIISSSYTQPTETLTSSIVGRQSD